MKYPIKLVHTNIISKSEVVTVVGGQFVALVRDRDYTMDYVNGIISFIITSPIIRGLPRTSDYLNFNIAYRYEVDFSKLYFLESHIEVFSEVASVVDNTTLQVAHSPVRDVYRVFNRTTKETYAVSSFLDNKIVITANKAPRQLSVTNQAAELRQQLLQQGVYQNAVALTYPSTITGIAKEHALLSVDTLSATTAFKALIRSGIDLLQTQYVLESNSNWVGIEIYTGSSILRRCKRRLIENTDYTFIVDNAANQATLKILPSGLTAIGSNSVYYKIRKGFLPLQSRLNESGSEHLVDFKENVIKETTIFVSGEARLQKLEYFYEIGQEVDVKIYPTLIVSSSLENVFYEENVDYLIDYALKRLVRLETSTKLQEGQVVKVSYIDEEFYYTNYSIMQDVVLVDYDYGSNSINWSPGYNDFDYTEQHTLKTGKRFVTLQYNPASQDVTFQYINSKGQAIDINVVYVDIKSKIVEVEAVPYDATYTVKYVARKQVLKPGTAYYVSYRYGARKRTLIDNYASTIGLDVNKILRTETFDLINNQYSVILNDVPIDYQNIIIYLENDPDKSPMATATGFDASTYTLEFTPITSAGSYVVEYYTEGYLTEQLRSAILALLKAFIAGPTKQSLVDMLTSMTGLAPDVVEAIYNGFLLADTNSPSYSSDYLNPLPARSSSDLSDGSSSIEYLPSRFANAVSLKGDKAAYVAYSAVNNVTMNEGTISFLTGVFWDAARDDKSYYFFDLMQDDEFTNRMVLYKNRQGLLCFELHDKNSKLYRVTTDIRWIPRSEVRYLEKGQNTIDLAYSPAYTIEDLNANKQSDIFEANRTKFVIMPISTITKDAVLNVNTLIQIGNNDSYASLSGYNDVTNRLRALANIYEMNNAKLTIQTELPYMQGCLIYDNVLAEMKQRGHDVQLFIDFPTSIMSDEDREVYILQRRNTLQELGITAGSMDGVAGGYEIANFVDVFSRLGFEYASAYVNPLTQKGIRRVDIFRASTGADFTDDSNVSRLVYLPGDMDIAFQKNPMIVQSFTTITDSLYSALEKTQIGIVNNWYFAINISEFEVFEIALFDSWLVDTITPLVNIGKVRLTHLTEAYMLFRENENLLGMNAHRTRISPIPYGDYWGGTQEVRALSWDELTNRITFDAVERAGYYLFSYISGFSKYEEAENLITCVWKLHTTDGQPPMVKLYLNGELKNHKTFGEL